MLAGKRKNLILIGGPMGVGKSAACAKLKTMLPRCAFLDGDWCWDMSPFIVNSETKAMVMNNICSLLNAFLSCSEFENVLFCWVMHERAMIDEILTRTGAHEYRAFCRTIVCSEDALVNRLNGDIKSGLREPDVIPRALDRLKRCLSLDTAKLDNTDLTAIDTAKIFFKEIIE